MKGGIWPKVSGRNRASPLEIETRLSTSRSGLLLSGEVFFKMNFPERWNSAKVGTPAKAAARQTAVRK